MSGLSGVYPGIGSMRRSITLSPEMRNDIFAQPLKFMQRNAFFAIFTLMVLLSATIMIVAGIDNTNAITIALSCISNVGPTLGTQIGPEMSWGQLPDYIKWICSFLMLVGRLEIMSVLVLFTRGFWKDN